MLCEKIEYWLKYNLALAWLCIAEMPAGGTQCPTTWSEWITRKSAEETGCRTVYQPTSKPVIYWLHGGWGVGYTWMTGSFMKGNCCQEQRCPTFSGQPNCLTTTPVRSSVFENVIWYIRLWKLIKWCVEGLCKKKRKKKRDLFGVLASGKKCHFVEPTNKYLDL